MAAERYDVVDETAGEAPTALGGGGAMMCSVKCPSEVGDDIGEAHLMRWKSVSVRHVGCGGRRCR